MKNWTTKTGEKIAIKDMETSHIENCIKMLERKLADKPSPIGNESDNDAVQASIDSEDRINGRIAEYIQSYVLAFASELRLRKLGKPIGEDFPLAVIQPWEVNEINAEDSDWE